MATKSKTSSKKTSKKAATKKVAPTIRYVTQWLLKKDMEAHIKAKVMNDGWHINCIYEVPIPPPPDPPLDLMIVTFIVTTP